MWGSARYVNVRMFDAKQRYRDWTGGGHRVHSTIEAKETDHDLYFILGERVSAYRNEPRRLWDGAFRRVERDPVGSGGWRTRAELLTAVELTLRYVLLPELEDSPGRLRLLVEGAWDHWGVQWLVGEPDEQPAAARGQLLAITIAGSQHELELRHVGDGYHEVGWQRAMLRDRLRDHEGAFVLPAEHEFFALMHELLFAGRSPSVAELARLSVFARDAGMQPIEIADFALVRQLLDSFVDRYRERSTGHFRARAAREGSRNVAHMLLRALKLLQRDRTASRSGGEED